MAGYYGISVSEYLEMSPTEMSEYCSGVRKKRVEELKLWRLLMAYVIAPHSKNPVNPEQILPLPDDEENYSSVDPELMSDEEFQNWLNS